VHGGEVAVELVERVDFDHSTSIGGKGGADGWCAADDPEV
jgi:hypothetical protein